MGIDDIIGAYVALALMLGIGTYLYLTHTADVLSSRNVRIIIARSVWVGLLWPVSVVILVPYALYLLIKYPFMELDD